MSQLFREKKLLCKGNVKFFVEDIYDGTKILIERCQISNGMQIIGLKALTGSVAAKYWHFPEFRSTVSREAWWG